METKTFRVVTSLSMVLTLTVAILSIIGVAITGLYPGVIVLLLVALIPVASNIYAKKSRASPIVFRDIITLTIINLLSNLVVLWMTFVIVHTVFFMTVVDTYQATHWQLSKSRI